jgi:hypothetical protein
LRVGDTKLKTNLIFNLLCRYFLHPAIQAYKNAILKKWDGFIVWPRTLSLVESDLNDRSETGYLESCANRILAVHRKTPPSS